jgi:uncharacterized metal-binding protein YceD (DUF177 family)
MDDTFRIFVHRLKDGHQEKIQESLAPDFLAISEAELAFKTPITIKGSAAVADGMLVLLLDVETEATMPCAICNEDVQVKICLHNFCHTESLENIKGAIFDYRAILREGILLELPYTTECNNGNCPERSVVAKYLSNSSYATNCPMEAQADFD